MSLTDVAIRKAKPGDKPYRLTDGGGLYLEVSPAGGKWWRFKYRRPATGKENRLSLGVYPDVPLGEARDRRDEARRLLAKGLDPGERRKATKMAIASSAANSFEAVGFELLAQRSKKLAPGSVIRERRMFEKDLLPLLGAMPLALT